MMRAFVHGVRMCMRVCMCCVGAWVFESFI